MRRIILILGVAILTGTGVYLLRPLDVETAQAKRRLAAAVLSKMEKDLSEYQEEAKKFKVEIDASWAQYKETVNRRKKVKDARDLAIAPEVIVKLEDAIAEEIVCMEEDLAAWPAVEKAEKLHLENLQAELERTPPEKAEALRQKIAASKKNLEEITEILEEAALDIEQAKQKVGR